MVKKVVHVKASKDGKKPHQRIINSVEIPQTKISKTDFQYFENLRTTSELKSDLYTLEGMISKYLNKATFARSEQEFKNSMSAVYSCRRQRDRIIKAIAEKENIALYEVYNKNKVEKELKKATEGKAVDGFAEKGQVSEKLVFSGLKNLDGEVAAIWRNNFEESVFVCLSDDEFKEIMDESEKYKYIEE